MLAGGTGTAWAAPAGGASSAGAADVESHAATRQRSRSSAGERVTPTRKGKLTPEGGASRARSRKAVPHISNDAPGPGAVVGAFAPAPSTGGAETPVIVGSALPQPIPADRVVTVPVAVNESPAVTAVATAISEVGSPELLGSGPSVPVESPLAWTVLAVARRQSGRIETPAAASTANAVANQPPVIAKTVPSSPNPTTGVVTGTVKATDPNGDKLTYSATTSAKGTVSITTAGVFTYTPTATARHLAAKVGATADATTDTVTVKVTDSKGAATTSAVAVSILPKNAAPTANATLGTPTTGTGVVTGSVTGADTDRDVLTYSAPATTAKGAVTVNAGTGAFTYTPTATARHTGSATTATAADKTDTLSITVTDGYGGSVVVPVTVTISPANTAPTATATVGAPSPVTGVASGKVTATDADKDALTYTASKASSGTVAVNADGTFTYTPSAAARASAHGSTTARTDSFTVTVGDGHGGSAMVTVTPTIAPANSAPVAGTPVTTTNVGTGVVTGTINATDPDKDSITYTAATTTTSKGRVTVTAAGQFTYTPTAAARHAAAKTGATAAATDSFAVTVTDKYGAVSTISVTVPVSPADTAPLAGAVTTGTPNAVTGVVGGTVAASDADSDKVSFSAPSITTKGTVAINAATGAFTYTPTARARDAAAAKGATAADKSDTFTVTIDDGYGGKTTAKVAVAISPEALIGYPGVNEGAVTWEDPPGKVVEVQTHLIVDKVAPTGLNFFALQVTFANNTWAHGGPQFNDGSKWLANWGGLANGYNDINWARDLLLIDAGEDKPNTVPWQWDPGREYVLTISRGDQIVLPAGINTAHDNVFLPERTMWVWNFSIVPVDGKGEPFTSRLFASADYISWYIMFNESGYGSTRDQQHTRFSVPVYRVEGSTDYLHPAWGARDQQVVFGT